MKSPDIGSLTHGKVVHNLNRRVRIISPAFLNPYLTHIINILLKTICCVIENIRMALHFEK